MLVILAGVVRHGNVRSSVICHSLLVDATVGVFRVANLPKR